jgi:hypothetical protein
VLIIGSESGLRQLDGDAVQRVGLARQRSHRARDLDYNDGSNCSRSPDAYGPLIAAARGYSLTFEACSGAKTTDVNNNQLGPLNSTTKLATITIGGNDAGFSNVIVNCALYYFTCQSSIDSANSFIKNQLPGLLDTTYGDIRSHAPSARVVVLGYPHLFTSDGKTCNFNTLTSSHEKELTRPRTCSTA